MEKVTPFSWINSINNKTPMDTTGMVNYEPFIINRGLSYFYDCVLYVNEMNKFHFLEKDIQYKFLQGVISKKKRFSKWIKKDTETELISNICNLYKVNTKEAITISELLNEEQKNRIFEICSTGGRK